MALEHPTLRIVAAPAARQPFPIDAVAAEEDTYLVLSAPPIIDEPVEHALRVLRDAHRAEPVVPGQVLVRPGVPLGLLAVVHDLDQQPSWREPWIGEAVQAVFSVVGERRLASLALPCLGTVHGQLAPSRFLELLAPALDDPPDCLRHLWLVVPENLEPALLRRLARQG
jgi:hypothetical protein